MSEFRFAGEWRIAAGADRVYAALADVEAYPNWWPAFADARRIDDVSGELHVHGLIPVELVIIARQRLADPERRVLLALFAGDVDGVGRWQINAVRGGTRARYDEHVAVRTRLARSAGMLARPVIYASHAHFMRVGERGLTRHLGLTPLS